MKSILTNFFALIALCASAHARVITVVVDTTTRTNTLRIASNESVTVAAHYWTDSLSAQAVLRIAGHSVEFGPNFTINPYLPVVGPAEITVFTTSATASSWAYWTFDIQTDTFPPDKTMIIPEGTGARIALECSTNLTRWTELYSVTETNSPTHKFFRIKAERLP